MKDRRQRLSSICSSHLKGEPGTDKFEAWDQRLSQDLKRDSFLVDHKRKLLYCWNHKVIIMLSVSGVPLINHLSNFWPHVLPRTRPPNRPCQKSRSHINNYIGIYASQIIRRAIKSPLLTPWDHIDVALDPLGPTTHFP